MKALWQLLAEKAKPSSATKDAQSPPDSQKATSPTKQLDYEAMPLARLKQLDKARDATIAFILKQIDAAEAVQKDGADAREP